MILSSEQITELPIRISELRDHCETTLYGWHLITAVNLIRVYENTGTLSHSDLCQVEILLEKMPK